MSKPNEQDVVKIISMITKKPANVIKPESDLRADLGMDSLAALDLLVTLEEQYQLVIPQEAAANFKTLQNVLDHVKSM